MEVSRRDVIAWTSALALDFFTGIPGQSLEARMGEASHLPSPHVPPEEGATLAAAKSVYLTIDDGPRASMGSILDAAGSAHLLTFFLIGKQMEQGSEGYRMALRALQLGHAIGNHSYTHPFLGRVSTETARTEVKKTDGLIKGLYDKAGRHNPKLFRFPYLSIGHKDMVQKEFGLHIIGWCDTCDTRDYRSEGKNTEKSLGILRKAPEHSIVLMHDYPGTARVIRELGAYGIVSQALGPGGARNTA